MRPTKSGLLAIAPMALLAINAHAARIQTTTNFGCGGDYALGVYCDAQVPVFDSTLGTLDDVGVRLQAYNMWEQEVAVEAPPPSIFPIYAGVFVSGEEIDAPPRYWIVRSASYGFSEGVTLRGAVFANSGDDITIEPFGEVYTSGCTGYCQIDFIDETYGDLTGTLTTTFIYTPTGSIPEPSSLALLMLPMVAVGHAVRRR